MRRLLPLAVLPAVLLAVPAGAQAELRFCKGFQARVGDSPVTGKVRHVRLTRGFACRDALRDVRRWIRGGGYMTHEHTLIPWTRTFGSRVRCRPRSAHAPGGALPPEVPPASGVSQRSA